MLVVIIIMAQRYVMNAPGFAGKRLLWNLKVRKATKVNINKGDYVLATKYSDGDPGDAWALGFYDGKRNGRYFVVDNNGNQMRHNGYRAVGRVRQDVGEWLLKTAAKQLELSPPGTVNLWKMLTPSAFPEKEEATDW